MTNYRKLATSAEVWAVIKARHHDQLEVFGSYSAPDGDTSTGVMQTTYGLKGAEFPLMGARTTWANPSKRLGEINEYWLCIAINNDDD